MKRFFVFASACALLAASLIPGAASAASYENLRPGKKARLQEEVPVNFVFVGYEQDDVDTGDFLAGLPGSSKPVVRSRLWYGQTERLGLRYGYDYDVTFADAAYEDDFFGHLSGLAEPADLTLFQQQYNDQKKNVLEVEDNHFIDAPSVERWLSDNAPSGVDTTENTIFFVNWYGRDDFVHHVYTKTDEPDPDTGYNFGELRESRKIIAWGGTAPDDEETGYAGEARRVWFYDLSAGPESWTDNWNVDNPDLDDNGEVDYRMPPIWEYSRKGYRRPHLLDNDLSMVARYVGLDLLFTSSPLYPPAITPPAIPENINLDSNTYEGWPGTNASEEYITPDLLLDELGELQPFNTFTYDEQDLAFEKKARRCYVLALKEVPCYPQLDYPGFANLFLYNALTQDQWQDSPEADYEMGLFNYATTDRLSNPFLGFADDNYRDGTQSYVFSFVSPEIANLFGYGLTTTMIHEVGHHIAMSHPHDGYDPETGVDFGPADAFYFAWSGDQTNSIMSYIDLNWDFSQFDRDNMNRFMSAAYITNAQKIAARVLRSDDADAAADELTAADAAIGAAQDALSAHDYEGAVTNAKAAYDHVRAGADEAGVEVTGSDAGTDVDTRTPNGRDRDRHLFVDRVGTEGHRSRR